MILSRLWYAVLGLLLAGAVFLVFLAMEVANRNSTRTAAQLLTAASNSVGWFLKDDARSRATGLIPLALSPEIVEALAKGSEKDDLKDLDEDVRAKAKSKLVRFQQKSSEDNLVFDALWAIDVRGRVVASVGYERGTGSKHFEMGGYALVGDALHGWVRDDAWVFDGQIYRVVGRPVEQTVGAAPVGALVGAKIVDDNFAQEISDHTGAALAFYAGNTRIASGAPPAFNKASLEITKADLEKLGTDKDYTEKGRTPARVLRQKPGLSVSAIFARMTGEAWDLGAGYVVGYEQTSIRDPLEFQNLADQQDKDAVPLLWVILIAVGSTLLGLLFTYFEHTTPLSNFRKAVAVLGDRKSEVDVLKPSTFRGVFKKIAASVNDGLDKIALQGGVDRGHADLESVLGPLPAKPQMSAFAMPDGSQKQPRRPTLPSDAVDKEVKKRLLPKAPSEDAPPPVSAPMPDYEDQPAPSTGLPSPPKKVAPPKKRDEEEEWQEIYEQFVALKKQLGEPTEKLTYEKFQGTLQRNKDALIARHGCKRVKFKVYEKNGKAALKASPAK